MTLPAMAAGSLLVLDTNVVFDWLVFANPAARPLADAIGACRVRWIATTGMRDEFRHVLGTGRFARWHPDAAALEATWARFCEIVPAPPPGAPAGRLRCTDADDQPFVDLAVAAPARWLVTRDRALLKLARHLREVGVAASTPERWVPGN